MPRLKISAVRRALMRGEQYLRMIIDFILISSFFFRFKWCVVQGLGSTGEYFRGSGCRLYILAIPVGSSHFVLGDEALPDQFDVSSTHSGEWHTLVRLANFPPVILLSRHGGRGRCGQRLRGCSWPMDRMCF